MPKSTKSGGPTGQPPVEPQEESTSTTTYGNGSATGTQDVVDGATAKAGTKSNVTSLADAMAKKAGQRQPKEKADRRKPISLTKIDDVWKDAPVKGLVVPDPYKIRGDRAPVIFREHETREYIEDVTVCAHPILPVRRYSVVDADGSEGAEHLEIAFQRLPGGKWETAILPKSDYGDKRKILALADRGVLVTSENAGDLGNFLLATEFFSLEKLPEARTAAHMGWLGTKGDLGFLWGRTHLGCSDGSAPIQFRGADAGDDQIAGAYTSEGALEGWMEVVSVLRDYPKALITLYAAFAAPLLDIIGAPNFVLDLAMRTSTGKSTALRASASVWGVAQDGAPNTVIRAWDSTRVFIERASSILSSMPLFLDDSKRLQKNPQQIADVLYMAAHGIGRGRGTKQGLAVTRTWRTVLISTGESPVTTYTQDGGTRARVIELRGFPFWHDDDYTRRVVDKVNLGVAEHYGHAGPRFVRWLLDHRDDWDEIKALYRQRVEHYTSTASGSVASRLAGYVAALDVAGRLAHEALNFPWEYSDPFNDRIWAEISEDASEAAGEVRALLDIMSWAYSNSETFDGRSHGTPVKGWSGKWLTSDDWDHIAILPTVLDGVLRNLGYEPEQIKRDWKMRGWLLCDTDNDSRKTKKTRFAGNPKGVPMVCIARWAVEEVEGPDPDGGPQWPVKGGGHGEAELWDAQEAEVPDNEPQLPIEEDEDLNRRF